MKHAFATLMLLLALQSFASAQTVNQLSIFPAQPNSNDTIFVVSDLSYRGNCDFGLVYTYSQMVGNTVELYPTYCGYWDTTSCNSIDTFKIAPLPNGNYTLRIQYHQGSICPISDFDATIFELDTTFAVTPATSVAPGLQPDFALQIYPNPAHDLLTLKSPHFSNIADFQLTVSQVAGGQVFRSLISQNPFVVDISAWAKGLYLLTITDKTGKTVKVEKVVVD